MQRLLPSSVIPRVLKFVQLRRSTFDRSRALLGTCARLLLGTEASRPEHPEHRFIPLSLHRFLPRAPPRRRTRVPFLLLASFDSPRSVRRRSRRVAWCCHSGGLGCAARP